MCLILLAYGVRDDAPLVVAANRDEFYARPALPAHQWQDAPQIFAGRDLEAGGTWLGVTTAGRFAAVTNYSETSAQKKPGSRGELVHRFLAGSDSATAFASSVEHDLYSGFSLLVFDGDALVYLSNRCNGPIRGEPGVQGLANTTLNVGWPKVRRGTHALASAVRASGTPPRAASLLTLLGDEYQPPDSELPERGRPLEFERRVAPCFIRGDEYGTRASTVVVLEKHAVQFAEQTFEAGGTSTKRVEERLPIAAVGAGQLAVR
jgi:uncharacterized protein with NRDE domain